MSMCVVALSEYCVRFYDEAARGVGAGDFVDKSRRLSILVKRLQLITEGMRPLPESGEARRPPREVIHLGPLDLRFDINRAGWSRRPLALTLNERKSLAPQAPRAGQDGGSSHARHSV